MLNDKNCAILRQEDKDNIWRMADALLLASKTLEFYAKTTKGEVNPLGHPLAQSRAAETLSIINPKPL